jgi:hypothetical protein
MTALRAAATITRTTRSSCIGIGIALLHCHDGV